MSSTSSLMHVGTDVLYSQIELHGDGIDYIEAAAILHAVKKWIELLRALYVQTSAAQRELHTFLKHLSEGPATATTIRLLGDNTREIFAIGGASPCSRMRRTIVKAIELIQQQRCLFYSDVSSRGFKHIAVEMDTPLKKALVVLTRFWTSVDR